MYTIDGSLGQGGGHTVRLALAVAAVLRQPVTITGIRRNRRAPGLRPDLVAVAKAMATITHGRVDGDDVGSHELQFFPGATISGNFEFALPADSTGHSAVTNLLQTALPSLVRAGAASELVLHGATHAANGPTATYLQTVFLPTLRKFGIRCDLVTDIWGWGDGAPGLARVRIEPAHTIRSADLSQRGQMLQIGGTSVAVGLSEHFAERQRDFTTRRITQLGSSAAIKVQAIHAESPGGMLFLLTVFERVFAGFTAIANANVAPEQIADTAVQELRSYLVSHRVLDKHLPDQILIYAALADGPTVMSTSEITPHTAAAATIIETMTRAKVTIDGEVGEPGEIEVVGAAPPW
ncbi:MAG TPA: RNA 3'-terminal phosphate cyclase [Blastocatellia bacterium]|nr:RNA 3'-terminal phosphate cyclase [Blastocatellia bacterium]